MHNPKRKTLAEDLGHTPPAMGVFSLTKLEFDVIENYLGDGLGDPMTAYLFITEKEMPDVDDYKFVKDMFRKDNVKAYVKQRLNEIVQLTNIDARFVLQHLKFNIEKSAQGVAVYDRDGNPTGEYTFSPNAVNKSCELIGRYLGMWEKSGGKDADSQAIIDVSNVATYEEAKDAYLALMAGAPHVE